MTAGEDAIVKAINKLEQTIEKLREDLVRKDVYESDQRLVMNQLQDVKDDVLTLGNRMTKQEDDRKADRRLVLTSFILPILVAIIMLYIATQIGTPT